MICDSNWVLQNFFLSKVFTWYVSKNCICSFKQDDGRLQLLTEAVFTYKHMHAFQPSSTDLHQDIIFNCIRCREVWTKSTFYGTAFVFEGAHLNGNICLFVSVKHTPIVSSPSSLCQYMIFIFLSTLSRTLYLWCYIFFFPFSHFSSHSNFCLSFFFLLSYLFLHLCLSFHRPR